MNNDAHHPDRPLEIPAGAGVIDPYATAEWQEYARQHFVCREPGAEEAVSLLETIEIAQTTFEALRWSRRAGDHGPAARESRGTLLAALEAQYGIAMLTVKPSLAEQRRYPQ